LSIFEKLSQNAPKNSICDDKKKLRSDNEKYFFKFVTIIFKIFLQKQFRDFLCCLFMATIGNNFIPKNPQKFQCEKCNYLTCNSRDFKKHLQTKKHMSVTQATESNGFGDFCPLTEENDQYICLYCNKKYADRTGLWRHKKKCEEKNKKENQIIENKKIESKTIIEKDDLIQFLINENKEFKQMMLEMAKNSNTNNSYNHTNSHNKTFNLQLFLNETCKDAMNIMDFVNSIEIDLDDLEKVGELGYVNGMTNIILKNLKALDITKRPLHCTDAKREIMYVKDDNKWEKENENKDKMKMALKYIVHKNAIMLNVFKAKYPDCIKSYSNRCDQYNKLVIEVLGGKGDNEIQNNEKILKRIAKEMTIDRKTI